MAFFDGYTMGFKVNNTAIPDPSAWTPTISDLDIFGERDLTGLLHRKRVATKQHHKLSYVNIPWDEAQTILALTAGESFAFRFMSPKTNAYATITAYRGAETSCVVNTCFDGTFHTASGGAPKCLCTLDLSIIEY